MQDLNGKRVVITGGSQGLGLAMVEASAACGVNVTAIGRESWARRCCAKSGEGEHVSCVTQLTQENRNGSDGSEFTNNPHFVCPADPFQLAKSSSWCEGQQAATVYLV
jgi:NAD(P)-dependent dehydrogenase (short-subunit alcohol dehydrogenase family)